MALKWRKKLLLAKVEAVTGTAQVLGAADAVLGSNIEITPLAGDTVSRDLERSYYGNSGDIPVNSHQTLSFSVELAGSGAAGTAPAWGKLLMGCGLAEVVSVSSRVVYVPVSARESSLTLGLNIDGQLHTLSGARGTFTCEINVNQIPMIKFSFTGLYNAPSPSAAVARPNYAGFKIPQVAGQINTPEFNLHGNSRLALSAFSYDHANAVTHRELINLASEVIITDRKPTGSITVDAPASGPLNLIERAKSATDGVLRIVHGVGAGKVIEFSAPKALLSAPSYSEADGAWQIQVPLSMLPSVGNDEIKITVK